MEDNVKQLEEEIRMKRAEITFLKDQIKKYKKPSQWLDKTLCKCMTPFVNIYNNSKAKLEDPDTYLAENLIFKTDCLYTILRTLDPEDRRVKKYLKKSIKMMIKLEEAQNNVHECYRNKLQLCIGDLEDQIERLRPPLTEEQIKERNKLIQEFQELC